MHFYHFNSYISFHFCNIVLFSLFVSGLFLKSIGIEQTIKAAQNFSVPLSASIYSSDFSKTSVLTAYQHLPFRQRRLCSSFISRILSRSQRSACHSGGLHGPGPCGGLHGPGPCGGLHGPGPCGGLHGPGPCGGLCGPGPCGRRPRISCCCSS